MRIEYVKIYLILTLIAFGGFFGYTYANEEGDGGAGWSMSTANDTLSEAETNAELQRASDAARANDPNWDEAGANDQKALDNAMKTDTSKSTSWKIKTIVSEMVPWAECFCYIDWKVSWNKNESCKTGDITTRKYQCTTESGMVGFQKVFAQIIRFVINIVMLLGVLAVVGLGIAWSFAGWDDMKVKSSLKTWAINLVIGFIILFMFKSILQFLAPWIYK